MNNMTRDARRHGCDIEREPRPHRLTTIGGTTAGGGGAASTAVVSFPGSRPHTAFYRNTDRSTDNHDDHDHIMMAATVTYRKKRVYHHRNQYCRYLMQIAERGRPTSLCAGGGETQDRPTDRQTNRQTDRHAGRQAGRHPDQQTTDKTSR